MANERVLVIEDDAAIRTVLGLALKSAAFTRVAFATRGDEGLRRAREERPDLVILDLMLPGLSGLDVAKALRADARTRRISLIMLTAKGEEHDIVRGLECGADDYIAKPFSPSVLVARVNAVLRRRPERAGAIYRADGLVVDVAARAARLDGAELPLTRNEFAVLSLLMAHSGTALGRARIIAAEGSGVRIASERALDVVIVGLRRKLGRWAAHLESVRGIGYKVA